jgi:Alpha/beta hydrolase domain
MSVTSLEVHTRTVVLDGQPFGAAGAYEKIVGILRFAADPTHEANAPVTDLARAPRNGSGHVDSWADFCLLRPIDPSRDSGCLLLDVVNRGRKMALALFNSAVRVPNPTEPADFGNGFLMRRGDTVAWVGWQHDVPRVDGMMALTVPRAVSTEARLTGLVRCEFRPNVTIDTLPLADRYHVPQPVLDLADAEARLTVREHTEAPEVAVAREAWQFTDASHVRLTGGFAPGRIYDLVYRAQDPPLVGLGFLAVRDTASWLRFAPATQGNPCAGQLRRACVFGISQSGRFLRHLLYLGLTRDEAGREVFDAVFPFVAGARRGEFNLRFGQPSLNAQHAVGDLFPFTHGEQTDPLTGTRDALLARLMRRGRLPKVFEINTSAEYWRGDASLVHIDVDGLTDVDPPATSRVYFFAGTQHTPGVLPPPASDPNTGGRGLQPFNVVDYAPLLRAALANLDRWVDEGIDPPPSAVPLLAEGTAVTAESTAATFSRIPGVRFPDHLGRPARLDFGPELLHGVCAELPPKVGAPYPAFVCAVDEDGNERAGIVPVEVQVPLGTFTGWNPRHPAQGAPGDLMSMLGSTLPFARTRSERQRTGDPRPSIAERYPSRDEYLARVGAAARALVAARYMLEEDVEAIVERAGRQWDLFRHGIGTTD